MSHATKLKTFPNYKNNQNTSNRSNAGDKTEVKIEKSYHGAQMKIRIVGTSNCNQTIAYYLVISKTTEKGCKRALNSGIRNLYANKPFPITSALFDISGTEKVHINLKIYEGKVLRIAHSEFVKADSSEVIPFLGAAQ